MYIMFGVLPQDVWLRSRLILVRPMDYFARWARWTILPDGMPDGLFSPMDISAVCHLVPDGPDSARLPDGPDGVECPISPMGSCAR